MSGTPFLMLAETDLGGALALPPGTDLMALHAAVVAEVSAHLSPAHAALLARPLPQNGRLAWQATGHDLRRFVDLPADGRRALLGAAGSILSDIRRLAESGRAPATASAWPGLRAIPGSAAVYAVDGRPVLAPWGQFPATDAPPGGLLAAYDDGVHFSPPPRTDWRPWSVALGCIALLALAAGLLLPMLAAWAQPSAPGCHVEAGQLSTLRQQADAELRGDELKRLLASVNDEIGRKQLLCALPEVQAPPPPPAPRPPPPPPRADLPKEEWDRHDLTMLKGCWHNTTHLRTTETFTGVRSDVQNWELCFDGNGHGRQTIRWTDGKQCTGPIAGSFSELNKLLLTDTAKCSGNRTMFRGQMQCTRVNDSDADCVMTTIEGPHPGGSEAGHFIR